MFQNTHRLFTNVLTASSLMLPPTDGTVGTVNKIRVGSPNKGMDWVESAEKSDGLRIAVKKRLEAEGCEMLDTINVDTISTVADVDIIVATSPEYPDTGNTMELALASGSVWPSSELSFNRRDDEDTNERSENKDTSPDILADERDLSTSLMRASNADVVEIMSAAELPSALSLVGAPIAVKIASATDRDCVTASELVGPCKNPDLRRLHIDVVATTADDEIRGVFCESSSDSDCKVSSADDNVIEVFCSVDRMDNTSASMSAAEV